MNTNKYLVSILSTRQKALLYLLALFWLIAEGTFWFWWIQKDHIISLTAFLVNSALLFWNTLMISYFFYFIMRMKKANPDIKIPKKWRVAMIVTKAPSEPFAVVKKTLKQMLAQSSPHDTWIADEDPTPEVVKWCRKNGVSISTRKNVLDYHRFEWPRRTKCKEGNLAYFYDHYGYQNYDFVIQLDADHVPESGYLEAMLRPFANPKVGYVSAPSICDTNAKQSWIARARVYAEATLQGPVQAGYSNGWAPLCFGSHYAVRTKALKQIGGIGPELAEDHSTTFLMNVHGWKGVHAIDAIAHGEGPVTFDDAMTQEFQWSRSLFMLLLTLTRQNLRKLPAKLKFQFLFAQLWYPLFVIFMIAGLLLPTIALIDGNPWTNISYLEFLMFSLLPNLLALFIVRQMKKQSLLRPYDAPLISWEVVLYQLARWPWVLWAIVMATRTVLQNKYIEFRVTPKGQVASTQINLRVLSPYLAIVFITSFVVVLVGDKPLIKGYFYFALLNASMYLALILVALTKHRKEASL